MTAIFLLIALLAGVAALVLWVRKLMRGEPEELYGFTRELTTAELNHVGLGSDGADEAIKRSKS